MVLGLAGAGMLFVGLRGILTRRATVYSGKWLLALIALCFSPQFLEGVKALPSAPGAALINIIIFPAVLLVFWLVTKGYICFGVSEELGAGAVKSVLGKLGLKHEFSLGSVRLEDGGVFQVSVQDWMGTMQIKAKNPAAAARTPALVAGLSEHFAGARDGVRYMPYWIYAFFGGLLLAMLLFLLSLFARLPHRNTAPPRQESAPARTTRENGRAPVLNCGVCAAHGRFS